MNGGTGVMIEVKCVGCDGRGGEGEVRGVRNPPQGE